MSNQQPMLAGVLIACSSTKLPHAAAAADLYCSPLFKKARAYAEQLGAPMFVLSAKHGLLGAHQVVEPYDETLNDKTAAERRAWASRCASQIKGSTSAVPMSGRFRRTFQHGERVVMLAGEAYAKDLVPLMRGLQVERPLKGLGIGEQLQALGRMLSGTGYCPDCAKKLDGEYCRHCGEVK